MSELTAQRDKEAIAHLDKAVQWFGVEKTIEILEDYNQDYEGLKDYGEEEEMDEE